MKRLTIYLGCSVKNYEMLMDVHILFVKQGLTYHKGLKKVIDCDCEKICSDNVNKYILKRAGVKAKVLVNW